jgi:hypothetical protein
VTGNTLPLLSALRERQGTWSATADMLKARVDRARTVVLALGVAGAVLETAATSMPSGGGRMSVAWIGAACLALIPLLSARFLSRARVNAWTRARSASEALKSEGYRFRARAEPYDRPETAGAELASAMSRIDTAVDDLRRETAGIGHEATPWSAELSPRQFLEERVLEQAHRFYRPRAARYKVLSDRFRRVELGLAVTATVLGVGAGVSPSAGVTPSLLPALQVQIGAWVAVLTTVGGAVATHAMAARYDRLISSYLATANRLETLAVSIDPDSVTVPSREWSAFVHRCEEAISTENESWKAIWAEKDT